MVRKYAPDRAWWLLIDRNPPERLRIRNLAVIFAQKKGSDPFSGKPGKGI
jgi:hypothetical protein